MSRLRHHTDPARHGRVSTLKQRLGVFAIAVTAFIAAFGAPLGASAQSTDFYLTFWGYVAYDESTMILLGELEPDDPWLAAEFVSPQYGDDFFDGFGAFDDYYIADSLRNREVDQIDRGGAPRNFDGYDREAIDL